MRRIFLLILLSGTLLFSCKEKEPVIPFIELRSGSGLVAGDATVGMNQTLTVKVVASKTDIDLNLFYVEYAYDGVSLPTLKYKKYVSGEEAKQFEKIYTFTTRSSPGNERWLFSVNDDDGNISYQEIKLRVQ